MENDAGVQLGRFHRAGGPGERVGESVGDEDPPLIRRRDIARSFDDWMDGYNVPVRQVQMEIL